MIAPAATPPAVVATLNKAAATALADPGVKSKLAEQGMTPVGDAPDHFRAFIAGETAKWAKVIHTAGIKVQ